MAAELSIDDSSWQAGRRKAKTTVDKATQRALNKVGDELLRLSQMEVPLKDGDLMRSGNSDPKGDDVEVGYHTPYAARLHQHPEYHFRNGRKGKYLTDPLRKNQQIFMRAIADTIRTSLGGYGL